ncbi:nucleoside monophosphate kinase [Streptomyces sp. NPDC047315]|uniref:nucleoside monophosphate kinase n=1 Tax=Streptomyces sp. NPDC047315 TaxID=3155142 RepID=UPI0033CD9F77
MPDLVVSILGPPGIGKRALASTLADQCQAPVFRLDEAASRDARSFPTLARELDEAQKSGAGVPNPLACALAANAIDAARDRMVLLDDYPRCLSQARNLRRSVRRANRSLMVVQLTATPATLADRRQRQQENAGSTTATGRRSAGWSRADEIRAGRYKQHTTEMRVALSASEGGWYEVATDPGTPKLDAVVLALIAFGSRCS